MFGRAFAQNEVKVNGYVIDVTGQEPAVPKDLEPKGEGKYKKWIVQFTGPVQEADKKQIVELGGRIGDYLPEFSFIVTMDNKTRKSVEALSFINGVVRFKPAYKINKKLKDSAGAVLAEKGKKGKFHVRVDGEENLSALLSEVHKKKGKILNVGKDTAAIELEQADLVPIAQLEEVLWIEEAADMHTQNDTAIWVVQTNTANSFKLWDSGIHGEGQIVGIGDTGIDYDMPWFRDPAGTAIGPTHRKLVGYDTTWGDDYDADWIGHGTHVAGTVGGDRTPVDGLSSANGQAPKAKFYMQDLTPGSGGGIYVPSDLGLMFIKAYDAGARIHTNSWGGYDNSYGTLSSTTDRFMWEHKDFLALFANGNSGPSENSVINPATAKNVISVGATLNGTGAESVTWFSSNGVTADGRIKPTVTAPGDGPTDGAGIISADSDGIKNSNNSGTIGMRGTSMATPAVAGAAALVRQYFVDGYYPSGAANSADSVTPSAALVKATIVNSAQNMTGNYIDASIPSTGQGWGRVNLSNTLAFTGDVKEFEIVDNAAGLATGESFSQTYYASGGKPLKVTLVWTDYPGAEGATKALVNDLDLTVTAPDGTTYIGNVFSGGESTTGGSADRLNVEEQVLLANSGAGTYTITVAGYNIPNGPQPFALAITGASSVTSKGFITLNKTRYNATSTVEIKVGDRDLNLSSTAIDTVSLKIKSNAEKNGELVKLNETGLNTGIFIGHIPLRLGPAVSKNGYLEVVENDTITTAYDDADDGSGFPAVVTDTAVIDLTPPIISSVTTSAVGETTATVTWVTDEATDSGINYGETQDRGTYQFEYPLKTQHTLNITNLKESKLYYYEILSTDEAGNLSRDNNGGAFHTFTTINQPPSLSLYSSNGSETYYENTVVYGIALDPSGVASVTVNGAAASYRANDGYYELSVPLSIGENLFTVVATDTVGNVKELVITVTRLLPPDLVVTSVIGPTTGATGDTITVTDTVTNNGPGDSQAFYTALFLSTDQAIDGSDIYFGNRYVPALAAGESSTATTTVSIPTGIAPGAYYFGAYADYWGYQYEADENNNGLAGNQIQIQGPDLVMTEVSGPATAYTAETVTVTNTVKNNGPGRASGFYVAVYLSADADITASDALLGYRYVSGLGSGETSTEATAVTVPGSLASGTYYLGAIADGFGYVPESDEINNAITGSQTAVTGPDLTMTTVSGPATALTNSTVTISNTVVTSAGGTSGFYVGVYLSRDAVLDSTDILIGYRYVSSLAPQSSNAEDTSITMPSSVPSGTYSLIAMADVFGYIPESDETNNTVAGNQITVIGPDLTTTAVSGPASALTGDTISVSNSVAADAAGGGASGFYVAIYLSADNVITTSDTWIGYRYVNSLAPGASSTESTAVTIPGSIASGTYYIGAVADAYNYVVESNEENNGLAGNQITIAGPELTMTAVSGPASALTGDTVTVSNTVATTAGGASGFYVGVYLSTDNVITTSDALIGYRYVSNLASRSSSQDNTAITVPSSIAAGTYYIGAIADMWGHVPESDEANNALAGNQITITGPDLMTTAVSGPASALTGDTVTVANTVTAKAGSGGATGFYAGIYLSADNVITTSDTLVATRYIDSLAAGASNTENTVFTLPSAVASGTYYIGVVADYYNHVVESDESNNAMAGNRITVTGPDLAMTGVIGPEAALSGETITVSNTVAANAAGGGATGFYVAIYLSADNVITTSDAWIGYRYVAGLGSGAFSMENTAVTIPGSIASGTYYIGAVADVYNYVVEADEANNALVGNQIAITGPDLTMTALNGPTTAKTGDVITVSNTAAASAAGGGASGFYVGIYLSTDNVITSSDALIAYRYVNGLAPGATSAEDTAITLPSSVASGAYYIGAVADVFGYIAESDENNNSFTGSQVTITGADLTVTAVSGPGSALTGESVTVNNTVAANAEGGGATGFSVGIYLSTDSTITTSDTLIATRYVDALAPGATSTESTAFTLPGNIPSGTYSIGAVADYGNSVQEGDETNNAALGNQIVVTGPDVIMTAVSGPASALTGQTVTVSNTVATTAGGSSGFYVGIYLSTDNVINTSDALLGYRYVSGLAPGTSLAEDTVITMPSSVPSGTYYIGAVADIWGYVPESDETNNTLAGNQMTITGPDLTMSSVSGPASALTGGSITISNTVAASATAGGATGFYVGIYLSMDAEVNTSDILLTYRYVSSLSPGDTNKEDTVYTLSSSIPSGTYYIGAIADVFGYAAESDETNNSIAGSRITITGPDLTMSSVNGPAGALTGDTITVSSAVAASASGGGATGFYVGIYLSADNVIDGSDPMIAYRYVGSLPRGETNAEDLTFALPSSLPSGTYYIGAIADMWGHVAETDETNNGVAGSQITITGPDLTMASVNGPASALTGDTITVSNTVTASAGGGGATGFYVGIYLSADNVIDGSDTLIAYRYVDSVPPGASNTENTAVVIPSSVPSGTYYIGAIADVWGYAAESDETNNTLAGNQIAITGPDLTMASVSGPTAAKTGDTITVKSAVQASADGGGATGFYVGIYLSTDNVVDGSDTMITYRYVGSLAPGGTNADDLVSALPSSIPSGTYFIGAIADMWGHVAESNEANNAVVGGQITITAPDLTTTSVSGPASAVPGETITVSSTVATSAEGGGASYFYVGIYLSTDNVIDGSDMFLGYRGVNGLAPGSSSAENTSVGIPGGIASGTYYIGALADVWNYVTESDETNNGRTGNEITITAP
jgi:subtilase family serine protease